MCFVLQLLCVWLCDVASPHKSTIGTQDEALLCTQLQVKMEVFQIQCIRSQWNILWGTDGLDGTLLSKRAAVK